MSSLLYPAPSKSKSLLDAFKILRPLLDVAKQRVNSLPSMEMIDSFSGQTVTKRIATAEMLQRIIIDVFKLKLIVDTDIVDNTGNVVTVCATVYILTKEGYQPYRTSTASETRGAGNFSPVLSAESRSIRLVLRSIGLRTDGEVFCGETASQLNDAQQASNPTPDAEVSTAETEPKGSKSNRDKKPVKTANPNPSTSTRVAFGLTLDKTSVDYVNQLRKALRAAKQAKAKSLSMGDFIHSVIGPNSPRRLEGCTTAILEQLLAHYASDDECSI